MALLVPVANQGSAVSVSENMCVRVCFLTLAAKSDFLQDWDAADVNLMNERLETLLSFRPSIQDREPNVSSRTRASDGELVDTVPGWRLLDAHTEWRVCPIGIHFPMSGSY